MGAPGETDAIMLETMTQARLRDPSTGLHLMGERHDVGEQLGVHVGTEPGRHRPQKHAGTPRRGVARKLARAERYAPGGSDGSGMEHFELSQEHALQPYSDDVPKGVAEPAGQIDDVLIGAVIRFQQVGQGTGRFAKRGPGRGREPERRGDTYEATTMLQRAHHAVAVVNVAAETVGGLEQGGEQIVGLEPDKFLQALVGAASEEVFDDELDLLLIGLMADEITVGIELMGHALLAEALGQQGLKLTRPSFHLECNLLGLGVEFGVGCSFNFLEKGVDLGLYRFVGQKCGALPGVHHLVGYQQLGEHRPRLRRPFVKLISQPLALVVVLQLGIVIGGLAVAGFSGGVILWRGAALALAEWGTKFWCHAQHDRTCRSCLLHAGRTTGRIIRCGTVAV